MKKILFLAFLFSAAAHANPFASGNATLGKKIFIENHCNSCHIQMVGGDGSDVFTRPNHTVRSAAQMLTQINFCAANSGVTLTSAQEHHLGAYLNQRYYHFP